MYALKAALKSKTGLIAFDLANLTSDVTNPEKPVNSITVKGTDHNNQPQTFNGTLEEDKEGSYLRNMFLTQAGKIKGIVHRVEVDILVEKGTCEGRIYFINEEGNKQLTHFNM